MSPFAKYGIVLPITVIIADQLSKWWATGFFDQPMNICADQPGINLTHDTTPFIDMALFCNTGVSFGMLGGDSTPKRWALTLLALAVCGLLLWTLRTTHDWLSRLGIGLIVGGAIGNAIDRALYGAVTDFVDVTDMVPFFKYIFNVADSAITVGVIALILGAILETRRDKALS